MSQPQEQAVDAAPPRWRAADPEVLDWAVWDGDCVLFHEPSGKTHLINGATRWLLLEILNAPRGLEQIEAVLGEDWPQEEREARRAETQELLWRLEELGLVKVG